MPVGSSLRASSIPISAMFVTISAARDHEHAAGVKTVTKDFCLPMTPAGNEGGVFTSTVLQVFNEMHSDSKNDEMTWVQLIERLRDIILGKGYTNQVPQLSSSVLMNVHEPFVIVPSRATGTTRRKRAILIGINYVDCKEEYWLTGCHNDVKNVKEYLLSHQGFSEKDMVILMDDCKHAPPTRENILMALELLTQHSEAGDVVFFHYSGHGMQCPDDEDSADEIDGMDEAIIPCDADAAGPILDDEIYYRFVLKMKEGVHVFTLVSQHYFCSRFHDHRLCEN